MSVPLQTEKVTILLATYNGAQFIDEQLMSIANQTWPNIDIMVSDDGSSDTTTDKIEQWSRKWTKGSFQTLCGPQKGYSENFRHLIINLNKDTSYVAFCDQDDVWYKDKISNAIEKIISDGEISPLLYCSRTRLIDCTGKVIGLSRLYTKNPSFENALTQSLAGGNTIVLNAPAFKLVLQSALLTSFFSHDWWCYQLITGSGGRIIYDATPQLDYRQHHQNIFGKNTGILALYRRALGVLSGKYSSWVIDNLNTLEKCRNILSSKNIALVESFQTERKRGGIICARFLFRNKIQRQTLMATFGLYLSALIGKLSA